jgi:hypothetical protein
VGLFDSPTRRQPSRAIVATVCAGCSVALRGAVSASCYSTKWHILWVSCCMQLICVEGMNATVLLLR